MSPRYVVLFFLLTPQTAQAMIDLSTGAEPRIECSKCPAKRTLFNIAWNCISTIIICTWISIHPNVPPAGKWKGLWRRLEMMFWTVIAPELVLAWAVRQWFAAWEIRDTVNCSHEGPSRYNAPTGEETNDDIGLITGLIRTIWGWFGKGPTAASGAPRSIALFVVEFDDKIRFRIKKVDDGTRSVAWDGRNHDGQSCIRRQ